jgi:NADPH-dependent 2,4-dienoyl-CoA reductase/sulfur reductase-like enzyme
MKRYACIFLSIFCVSAVVLSACEREVIVKKSDLDPEKPDVVLIGSEIEGIYLARAAKDEGLSVVILDPREKPGGQLIQGEMLYLDEASADGGESLLQGRVKELFSQYKKGKIRKIAEFEHYYNTLLEGILLESGITLNHVEIEQD